ncbi:MAG: hypothetical protein RL662_1082 [Bacteroidota bacterium]|jgi:hypothetical protein
MQYLEALKKKSTEPEFDEHDKIVMHSIEFKITNLSRYIKSIEKKGTTNSLRN